MSDLVLGIVFLLIAVLLLYLGIRSRKSAYQSYQDDLQRCTAVTTVTVTSIDKSEEEQWEDRDDGSRELVRYAIYTATLSYSINGKDYTQTVTERYATSYTAGQQLTGYYDPADPGRILLGKPKKPILGGFLFFLMAAILAVFGLVLLYNYFSLYFW